MYDNTTITPESFDHSGVPVGKEVDFDIITTGAGKGQAQVLISSPSGKVIAAKIEETIDGFGAKFTPMEVGPHSVQVEMLYEMRD